MLSVKFLLQLFVYLTALIGLLPVLSFLAWWVQLSLFAAFLIGIVSERQGRYLLTALPATLFSVAFFGLFLFQVSLSTLVEPLIQMLCLLLAVRLATEKTPRNILQLFLLATIILAASSLLSLDLTYLICLLLIILLVTSGLMLLSFYAADQQLRFNRAQWKQFLKVMLLLPGCSLLLMLLFFVLLPRTQTPLWDFLNPKKVAATGMTDQVRPGSVTDLAQSSLTAFRVESDRLPVDSLYWRGVVLDQLDGQVWKRKAIGLQEQPVPNPESSVQLQFFTEPKADRYLVTLDQPQQIAGIKHQFSADGVVTGNWVAGRKVSYQVFAQYAARSKQIGVVDAYLQLPQQLSPRVLEVGRRLAIGSNYQSKMAQLNDFMRGQQLSYSNLQLPITTDPVDTFLFTSKRGYCEYFASSYALLLRLAGVPARLVGGYLGGDYNELGGYYLVGEDLAHVWVEALDDSGLWQRIDPSRFAVNAEQALWRARRQELPSFQALSDAAQHYWSRLVLNYDLHQQVELFRQVARQVRGVKSVRLESLAAGLWLLPLPLLVLFFYAYRQRRTRRQRLVNAYRRQALRTCRLGVPLNLGIFALARLSGEPLCSEFAEIYARSYYRDQSLDAADYRRLQLILKQLSRRKEL
ncbi:MAG TPA: transglutaminaseTgpA domain-containing protein [Malonomonas sp.]